VTRRPSRSGRATAARPRASGPGRRRRARRAATATGTFCSATRVCGAWASLAWAAGRRERAARTRGRVSFGKSESRFWRKIIKIVFFADVNFLFSRSVNVGDLIYENIGKHAYSNQFFFDLL